jgi:hypothetical protein
MEKMPLATKKRMEIMGVLRVIATAALATAWIALAAAASLVAEVGADLPIRQVPLKWRELVNTPEQRHLLKYLVSCSLPRGVEVYVDDDGERHTFPGSLGLAPAWEERGLTETEQRWVSACILARTNAFGKSVPISMRATEPAPPALQVSEAERKTFNLFEGAFFGNIFAEKPVGYVCRGARAGHEAMDPIFADRVCTEPSGSVSPAGEPLSRCGFVHVGPCDGVSAFTAGGTRYREVIFVYLKPKK